MTGRSATVLLPTTGDRGALLRHSIASVLAQTVDDLELFVVGDGMSADARAIVMDIASSDGRVSLVEHPKHERRGEPYRHRILTEQANGGIVAYLCDRDLWMPTHLEELIGVLGSGADLGHTLRFDVTDDARFRFRHTTDLTDAQQRLDHRRAGGLVPLSFAGHTLAAYRKLPEGWRTTPPGSATDRYMWAQFLDQPWCRVGASPVPTVLYFKRGDHPGLSNADRLRLLEAWAPRVATVEAAAKVQRDVVAELWRCWASGELSAQRRLSRPWNRLGRRLRRLPGAT